MGRKNSGGDEIKPPLVLYDLYHKTKLIRAQNDLKDR